MVSNVTLKRRLVVVVGGILCLSLKVLQEIRMLLSALLDI